MFRLRFFKYPVIICVTPYFLVQHCFFALAGRLFSRKQSSNAYEQQHSGRPSRECRQGMEDVLKAALSPDNAVRRRAEQTLTYAKVQRGFAVALATKLSKNAPSHNKEVGDESRAGAAGAPAERAMGPAGATKNRASSIVDDSFTPTRMMAGMLLQHFVRDHWGRAGHSILPPEDKAQVAVPLGRRLLVINIPPGRDAILALLFFYRSVRNSLRTFTRQ